MSASTSPIAQRPCSRGSRARVAARGAAVAIHRRARALEAAQHVTAQPPQLAAPGLVRGARRRREAAREPAPRPVGPRLA